MGEEPGRGYWIIIIEEEESMSRQVLQMKYHPAKKEVAFERVISGKETIISGSSGSVLSKYVNKRGQFVLQDHGNQLFADIVEAFDGEENVKLDVTMTKKDYEDFMQMVNYFNETSDVKINPNLLAELPDMGTTYEAVKKHGLKSIDVLNANRNLFHTVKSDNENVLKCIENFSKEINDAAKGINKKIETLEQNSVNVCFSGPYSAGKSSLINSLIGYAILPTAIDPKTAAMCTIRSPRNGENVRIVFNMIGEETSFSELAWNENENVFEFVAGAAESFTKKEIQKVINSSKEQEQYIQLRNILEFLNLNSDLVERVIDVYFPLAIDNDKVQFTIFDTPGTDSGVAAHRNILKDALAEQTHSILVFVTYPNGLSGGGNKALLEYLSEIENKEDKSTIDLGRSLFVINYADSLSEDSEFDAIRTGKITNKKDVEGEDGVEKSSGKIITIKLSDKKIFFTTAKYGYAASASINGIATKADERLLRSGAAKDLLDEELGMYYRQDRCATSEYATQLLFERCDNEMRLANENDDFAKKIWVASGLFALENEIQEYGEKYASAVKAYSIIDGVDKALARLDRNAQSIERQNSEDIRTVENEIVAIRKAIANGINEAKKGKEIGKNDQIPETVVKQLHLDADAITNFVQSPANQKVDAILLGFWQKVGQKVAIKLHQGYAPAETAWDENKENAIEQVISDVLGDYTEYFKKERIKLLEQLRDEFISDIQRSISQNGEVSDAAKKYIAEIETPDVEEFVEEHEFGDLYRQKKRTKKVLWMEKEYLDRESFVKDMNKKLRARTRELADIYKENYRQSLNSLLRKVESEFNLNMENYSISLKAKLEDKEAMESLKCKILVAVEQLHECQRELDAVIWEVKEP